MRMRRLVYGTALCLLGLGIGCGDDAGPNEQEKPTLDAGVDASGVDAGGQDSGVDSGGVDAGAPDTGERDSGGFDVGPDADEGEDGGVPGAPTAVFSVGPAGAAGEAIAFDAAASTDPDGEPLLHSWRFGDGELGGGESIAHIFDEGGDFVVELTVTDAEGLQDTAQQTVSVAARPDPAADDIGALTITGRIFDAAGVPLENMAVSVLRTGVSGQTDADGRVELTNLDADTPLTLAVEGAGYADQIVNLTAPSGSTEVFFETMLVERAAPVTLSDVEAGASTPPGVDGASLTLPADALVDPQGNPVTGDIDVRMTPVDISADTIIAFPGDFAGVEADGARNPIASLGTVEFELEQNGQALQLAAGKSATVRIPMYTTTDLDGNALQEGDDIALWALDESVGVWVQEGVGQVVASPDTPTGLAFEAQVGHFSWWNCDIAYTPYYPKPVPRLRDSDGAPTVSLEEGETATITGLVVGNGPSSAASAVVGPDGALDGLPVPPDRDVRLQGWARNGLLYGEVVINGAAQVVEEVVVPLDPIDAGGGGEALSFPAEKTAGIDPADEIDRYTFTGSAGDIIRIQAGRSAGSNLSGTVSLFVKDGLRIGFAAFDGPPGTIVEKLPADGEYVIAVDATSGAPGGYTLSVDQLAGAQLDTNISGTFAAGQEFVTYAFEATAGTMVTTGAKDIGATRARLQDFEGNYLTTPFGDRAVELPADGIYMIEIENRDVADANPVLDYEVGLAVIDPPASPTFSGSRTTIANSIAVRGDRQIYSISAEAGDGLAVGFRGVGATPLTNDLGTDMNVDRLGSRSVLNPADSVRSNMSSSNRAGYLDVHLSKLPGSGADTYIVTVTSRMLGDYELVIDHVPHAAQITVDDDLSCAGASTYSLAAALQAIDANGTVTVCDGAYRSPFDALIETAGVTLEGTSPSGVVLEGYGNRSLQVDAADVTVRGLTIEHADTQAIYYSDAANFTVENAQIQPAAQATGRLSTGIGGYGANLTLRNVAFDSADKAVDHSGILGGGLIEDCTVTEASRGFEISADGLIVRRNTITLRDDDSNNDAMRLDGGAFTIEDNTITIDLMGSSYSGAGAIYIEETTSAQSTTTIRDNSIEFIGGSRSQDNEAIYVFFGRADARADVLVARNNIALKSQGGGIALQFDANQYATLKAQNNIVRNLGWKGIRVNQVADAQLIGLYNNSVKMASTTSSSALVAVALTDYDATTGALPVELVNNAFDGSAATTTAVEFYSGVQSTTIDSDHNLWFGFDTMYKNGSTSSGANELTAQSPQFQNDLLEVPATSPVVDAGASTTSYPNVPSADYNGTARPTGAGFDIGAYEQ